MTDGAKATLKIELTQEELGDAVREYVVRRYSQSGSSDRVLFCMDTDAVRVTAELTL